MSITTTLNQKKKSELVKHTVILTANYNALRSEYDALRDKVARLEAELASLKK